MSQLSFLPLLGGTIPLPSGYVVTVGAVTADVMTIPLGTVPAKYKFFISIDAFDPTTPSSLGYFLVADIRTTGAAGVVVNSVDGVVGNEEAALVAADWDAVIVGNSVVVQVLGVAAKTIRWKATASYTFVS